MAINLIAQQQTQHYWYLQRSLNREMRPNDLKSLSGESDLLLGKAKMRTERARTLSTQPNKHIFNAA